MMCICEQLCGAKAVITRARLVSYPWHCAARGVSMRRRRATRVANKKQIRNVPWNTGRLATLVTTTTRDSAPAPAGRDAPTSDVYSCTTMTNLSNLASTRIIQFMPINILLPKLYSKYLPISLISQHCVTLKTRTINICLTSCKTTPITIDIYWSHIEIFLCYLVTTKTHILVYINMYTTSKYITRTWQVPSHILH